MKEIHPDMVGETHVFTKWIRTNQCEGKYTFTEVKRRGKITDSLTSLTGGVCRREASQLKVLHRQTALGFCDDDDENLFTSRSKFFFSVNDVNKISKDVNLRKIHRLKELRKVKVMNYDDDNEDDDEDDSADAQIKTMMMTMTTILLKTKLIIMITMMNMSMMMVMLCFDHAFVVAAVVVVVVVDDDDDDDDDDDGDYDDDDDDMMMMI
ncbi:hypothetical protein PoB_007555000 [Plakobranchus ocellatus]|uniref:Uncharacterized protein n=1 Tax=Plakobranchus ocellatus TaxID=259542 RepID=A0AAV4DXY3_9GAST|nr:hypothetical protein PoB_007555000 [Plakobranchus ocellatus]